MLEEAFNDEIAMGFNWHPIRPRTSKVRYRGSWVYQKLQRLLEKIHNFFQRIIRTPSQKFKIAKRRGKGSMPRQLFLTLSGENSMALSLVKHLGKLRDKENSIAGYITRNAYFAEEYEANGYAKLHQLMEKILKTVVHT